MIIIGLTGSIGMGKSTLAAQCAQLGAKTLNSDDVVHRLMQPGGRAFSQIAEMFPEAVIKGVVDRKRLGEIVFPNDKKMKMLEAILHPLVIDEEKKFARVMKKKGARVVVFDIPLLFETNGDRRMDLTLVATAPGFVQRQRVLARPRMTREKFTAILKRQMPDSEKRKRADVIVTTGLGKAASMRQIKRLFSMIEIA